MKKYLVKVWLEDVGLGHIYPSAVEVEAHNEDEAREKAELKYEVPIQPVHVLSSEIVDVIE